HSTSLRAASNRGLVRGPELPPKVHRSFASLRMTRERENETPFAQNATLLADLHVPEKARDPSTSLRASSFDFDHSRPWGTRLPVSRWHEQIGDPTIADGI